MTTTVAVGEAFDQFPDGPSVLTAVRDDDGTIVDFLAICIHLNVIEAADDPAVESWLNLQAIDDVVREILETGSHFVISALSGDAAAGGVPFALAARGARPSYRCCFGQERGYGEARHRFVHKLGAPCAVPATA